MHRTALIPALVLILAAAPLPAAAPPAELWVSADRGWDAGDGSRAAPLRTLGRAVVVARRLPRPLRVRVEPGTYYLNESLAFAQADGGASPAESVLWAAEKAVPGLEPPGRTVISGGAPLAQTCWKRSAATPGAWSCVLPPHLAGVDIRAVWVGDEPYHLARWPDRDDANPSIHGHGYAWATDGIGGHTGASVPPLSELAYPAQPSSGFRFACNGTRWARPSAAAVHIFPKFHWGNLVYRVGSMAPGADGLCAVHFRAGGGQINAGLLPYATDIDNTSKFFVEGLREFFDSPGEFWVEKKSAAETVLHILPRPNHDLTRQPVVIPRLVRLVEYQGSAVSQDSALPEEAALSPQVANLHLQGFTFQHAAPSYLLDFEAPDLGDMSISRQGALWMEGVVNCSVTNLTFDRVQGNAVFISHAATNVSTPRIEHERRLRSPGSSERLLFLNRCGSTGVLSTERARQASRSSARRSARLAWGRWPSRADAS